MQKSNLLDSGTQRYQEWMDGLLPTPEVRLHFEKTCKAFDVVLELIEARLDAGWSQSELAKRMGVTTSQIVGLEHCGYHAGNVGLLRRYANMVGKELPTSLVFVN